MTGLQTGADRPEDTEQLLWEELLQEVLDLEVFEPILVGFKEQINNLRNREELSNHWLNKSERVLKQNADPVVNIAFKLNEIAGIFYNKNDKEAAERIGMAALIFSNLAIGLNHPATRTISNNLRMLIREDLKKTDKDLSKPNKFARKTG